MKLREFSGVATAWLLDSNGERAVLVLLAVFIPAWTLFHVITYASIGLHPDLTEMYSWGRHPFPGYYKHPPLGGLMSAAWFSIFPVTDWSFDLLAMVNAAAALYAIDLIARLYLSGDKRLMVLLLLLMTPFYQFHAQRFGANQTLLATWPLAVYCFLRAFESRALAWSIAAGVSAALALLGKYYSIYLIAGIGVGALTHPKCARYLRSSSPWISAAAGLVVLAPHLIWLVTTGFEPFHYAFSAHAGDRHQILHGIFNYLTGAAAYFALPAAVYLLVVRPDWRSLTETLWPPDPDRRMLVAMFAAFLFLPAISSPFLNFVLTSLWTMPIWFLLPIILLAPDSVHWPRLATTRSVGALLILTALALAFIAPTLAWINFSRSDQSDRRYYRPLSEVVTRIWHARFGRPLMIVLGRNDLAAAVTFYSRDHPDSVPNFDIYLAPWVTPARIVNEGWAAICPVDDAYCLAGAASLAAQEPQLQRSDVEIVPHFLGFDGQPARFVIEMVPPRRAVSRGGLEGNPPQ